MTQNATVPEGTGAPDAPTACVANIGPRERTKRLTFGIGLLAVGALLAVVLVLADVHHLWRLTAFLPFWASGISLFQVREKTCVALSRRGVRNMDHGEEAISDPEELRQVRLQARRVRLEGFALAVVLTLVFLALP